MIFAKSLERSCSLSNREQEENIHGSKNKKRVRREKDRCGKLTWKKNISHIWDITTNPRNNDVQDGFQFLFLCLGRSFPVSCGGTKPTTDVEIELKSNHVNNTFPESALR